MNQDIKVLIPYITDITRYLQLLLKGHEGEILQKLVKGGMTVQSLLYSEFFLHPFSLPPLPEQHRIVTKVDQLMVLCDELEAKQQRTRTKLTRLNNAALDRLTSARDVEDFAPAWELVRDNFDLFYTTPETIAKLRQGILQLAVQGKLVPQDPTDEPASVLLAKIKAEKERLVKEKGLGRGGSRTAQATQVSPDEVPYELPQGWKWARVGETAEKYVDCPHATPHYTGHGYICLRAPNIVASNLLLQEVRYVSPEEYKTRIQRLKPRKNDLIYIREGGRLGIAGLITSDESFCLGQRLMLLRFVHTETAYYVSHFLNAPLTYAKFVGKILGGASPHVNVRDVVAHPIPLPPLAEQHRIVAKVDQLMAFCDDLEARLTKAQAKAEKLTAATVQGLLAA